MSNSIKVLAEEHPTYFLCSRRDIPQLIAKAEEEAAQILKRRGADGVMNDPAVRAEFVEELCDVMMYYGDVLLCYGITPEEFEAAYRAKHERNMTRWKIPENTASGAD